MTSSIVRVEQTPSALLVWLMNTSDPLVLPWFWVRDHSQDPESLDNETQQRTVNTFAIDLDCSPTSCRVVDSSILVRWDDNPTPSVLPEHLLRSLTPESPQRDLWSDPKLPQPLTTSYKNLIESEDELARWLQSIDRVGFGLVDEIPLDVSGAESLANRIGYVRRTVFGDMWTLSSEVQAHADSAYGDSYLEPHTDGSYSHDGPGIQLFACSERTGSGGESVLVDGFAAADRFRQSEPEAFAILTRVNVPAHYVEAGVELRAARPTIATSSLGWVQQVTFNNYDRSPFLLEPTQMRKWYEAYVSFHDLLVERSSWWTHRLEPGEGLLFDNWRCLHGRLPYDGRRVFHGCYLNHEDLESRLRVLGQRSSSLSKYSP